MRVKLAECLLLTIFFVSTGLTRSGYAESPALSSLKTHIAALQQILADPQIADRKALPQRRKLARVVLQQLFDFEEMSRRSLGSHARRYSDRLAEFTPLFVDFLEHAYMGKLEENGDAKVQYVRELVDNDSVQIDTKTKLRDGNEYSINYKLYSTPMGWRAYDIVVEGISLVNNYRAQFDRFLSKRSLDELLQEIRDKKNRFS